MLLDYKIDGIMAVRLNRCGKEFGSIQMNQRPDGGMTLTKQIQDVYALGFCEVKPASAAIRHLLTHTDTFRLAMFCKNAFDREEVQCTLGIQAVGKLIQGKTGWSSLMVLST